MEGLHDKCSNDNCLCKNDKHGESLKYGVIEDSRFAAPKDEPLNFENGRHDAERLEDLLDNGPGNNSPLFALVEVGKLFIYSKHMVSKFDLVKSLKEWCLKFRVEVGEVDVALDIIFGDMDVFDNVRCISNNLGRVKKNILFDRTQLIEAGEWLKGRYFIKRIEVTGDLLFYNDQFYETNAEALIRRNARSVIAKPKTTDISEVVKYIEDTCKVITWKDIEHSIHLKCLLNGIYDIKTGIFSSKFDPDYIILNQIPHNYNEIATFEKIEAKVKTLIPNDSSRQSYYDFLSTCLHPYTGVDFQFGCIGRTGTGKSQLGFLAEFVLGEKNVKDATIHLLAKDQTTQKNVAFKMLNIDGDLSNESIQQIDVIKKWITQDKFTARGIYEQSSDFRPMSRLMFMANDLYEIANPDDADAIYDRTYIIRVDKKFRHEETEIKNLMKKTATEDQLEGFITYLLKNASWVFLNESYHHKMPVSEVESIWNTFGNRIRVFVNKWIEKGPSYRTEQSEPFNKWMSYCIHHDFKARTKKHFSDIFEEIVGNTPTKTRIDGNECYAYSGFRIKTDEEIADEETRPFNSGTNDKEFQRALKALSISMSLLFSEKKNKNVKNNIELGASRAFESDDD